MEILLRLNHSSADVLRRELRGRSHAPAGPLAEIEAFGASIHPLRDAPATGRMAGYFRVEVAAEKAEALRARLAALDGVESATLMPGAEPAAG